MASSRIRRAWLPACLALALLVLAAAASLASKASFRGERDVLTRHGARLHVYNQEEEEEEEGALATRSVGGTAADPSQFPWLATIWFWNSRPVGQFEGRFAGFLIRLNTYEFVTLKRACDETELDWVPANLSSAGLYSGQQILFNLEREFEMDKVFRADSRDFGCNSVDPEMLGDTDFGIFQLYLFGHYDKTFLDPPGRLQRAPPLQTDMDDNENCFLFSYSGDSDPVSRWPKMRRKFSKIPVLVGKKCYQDTCELAVHQTEGRICPDLMDGAAPIMCGRGEPKLSFILMPPRKNGCTDYFQALSVAFHHEKLAAVIQRSGRGPNGDKPDPRLAGARTRASIDSHMRQ